MLLQMMAAALSNSALGAPNVITLSDDTSDGSNGRTAGIRFQSNGNYSKWLSGVPIVQSVWETPQSNPSEYEIRVSNAGPDAPDTGTLDTWIPLSSTQSWTLVAPVEFDSFSSVLTVEIRWTGNDVVQDTATYTLSATGPH